MRNPSVEKLTLASYYLDVDKPASALRSLDGVDESVLDDAEYWRIRGSALYLLERYGEASKVLSEGLKLAPEDAPCSNCCQTPLKRRGIWLRPNERFFELFTYTQRTPRC